MATKIVIIGSGEIGKAIQYVLAVKKDLEVVSWSRSSPQPLTEIVPQSNIVFLCVPSWAMAEVITSLTPLLPPTTILVSLAKGVDTSSGETMDQLLRPPFALLAGPMLAEELMADLPGSAVIATADQAVYAAVSQLFTGTILEVESATDVPGTALASVLKNVYALGLGIATAQKSGDNHRGGYISHAVAEMALLCGSTAYSLAGLGDLVATGFSPYSTNHQTGMDLLAGKQPAKPSEGLHSLPTVVKLFTAKGTIPPLLASIITTAHI
ncbi:MAG: hypothetical protein Q7S31_00175 [bacterium]|nr:hypothetical protein [bacterium]